MLVAVGDLHPFFASDAATEYGQRHGDWIAALQACRFGDDTRQGIELERIEAGEPIVDQSRFYETVARALECAVCRGVLRLDGAATLSCSSCGYTATLDQAGAYDLRRDALAPRRKRWRGRKRFRGR
jgi:hypothetical protein